MRNRTMRILMATVTALVLAGCAKFYITPGDFVKQAAETQSQLQGTALVAAPPLFFAIRYSANSMTKILCRDKVGNLLYLFPDRNTQLEITSKSTGDVIKMYFDTVFLEGDKLVGLRSRLLPGMAREILLSDIQKIEIYAEFPEIQKANPNTQ